MKKIRIYFVAVIMMLLGLAVAIGISNVPIRAANEDVGVIAEANVPDWVRGHEDAIKAKFLAAYTEHGFTVDPDSTIQPLDLIRGTTDHKRYALVQQFGTEGILLLNDVKGKVLAVKDPVALAELNALRSEADHNLAAQLLDVVESDGKIYYVTDRRNEDGIFHIEAGEAVYLDKRIGIGTGTFGDIMWWEYYKAYQAATNHMDTLGLPLEPVALYEYNTVDLTADGKYDLNAEGEKQYSLKKHTKQQFENGWIIQAPIQPRNAEGGLVWGHQKPQHAAAPITNEMYALVTGLADNDIFEKTGVPVSIQFDVEGVLYQNFEYGYVKVEEGIATFYEDLVVDSHGTEMPRRVGISLNWDDWRIDRPDHAGKLGILYERLRISQNFRETVGQMVRDGRAPFRRTEADPTGNNDVEHSGSKAPWNGIWFSFKGGEGAFLGAANSFIYQYDWYMPAFELAPALNTAQFVDAKDGIGRPNQEFVRFHNVQYQFFTGGFGFRDLTPGENPVHIIGEEDMTTWLDGAATVEEALLAKGIAKEKATVKFVDHDDTVLKTVFVDHRTSAVGQEPENPTREHYTFDKWDKDFSFVEYDITVKPVWKAVDYNITYELDGGENNSGNPDKANILSNIELLSPTKTGEHFMGWYKDAEFTERITHLQAITQDTTIYAKFVEEITADLTLGKFSPGTVPAWLQGHEEVVKTKFTQAYQDAEFTAVPDEFVKSVDLGRTRVLVYQVVGTEGVLFLNELEGKVIVVTDMTIANLYISLLTDADENNKSLFLGIVESESVKYYVTDEYIVYFDEGEPTHHTYQIGIGTDLVQFAGLGAEFTNEAIVNDFTIAWNFSQHFMQNLGLPLEKVVMKEYTTLDLTDAGLPTADKTTSLKSYYSQKFENGYIIMSRHSHKMQHAAAPILNDMFTKVTELEGNSDLSKTGAPVSIEFTVGGVRYQNFEYGYVKVTDDVAEYIDGWVVDSEGFEVNRRAGMPREFINWHWEPTNRDIYKVGWERLRISQNFRDLIGQLIKSGRAPYKVTEADPFGNNGFAGDKGLINRGGGSKGLWIILTQGDGEPLGWGNVFLLQGYWYNKPQELMPDLNIGLYVDAGENLGRPVDKWHQLYNARYQVFENGVGYIDGIEGPKAIIGDEFVTWLGAHESVHDAMLAHGIAEAEHTVTWMVNDEVIKTEQVPHGEAGTPPEVTPPEGFIFSGWDQEYDEILLPNRIIKAVLGSETGTAQEGTYKFINYETDGETASFWYEDETKVIEVNEALYNAFRATKLTMGESIMTSGLPVYADETNLITTKFWFYIEDEEVKTKATIGQLPESVTSLVEIGSSEPVDLDKTKKNIIQDSFGDAYVFAFDRGGHNLGLPVGEAQVVKEIINPSQPDTFNHLIIQEFEHGKIIQQGYNRAAYPIYGDMLTFWEKAEAEGGAGGIDGIGIPTTRQFEYEGKVFQSFKYGYIIKEGETFTPTFGENPKQLDQFMQEVDSRFGRWTSRSDAKKAHPDFEHEFLRTHEAYLEVHARWTKERNYIFGLIVESNVIAWNSYGASQGFSMGSSTSDVWGQTRFTPIPYLSPFASPHPVRSGILDSYAGLGGNEAGGPGYPLADDYTVEQTITHNNKEVKFDVMYQNFEHGYIRSYRFGDSLESEYFVGYRVDETGKHINMETNEVEETPEYILRGLEEGPEVSKDALIAKLNELKQLRAQTKELVGDLDKLPSNQYYASKDTLTEIDSRIAALEALIARDDLTDEEIQDGLTQAQQAITRLNNNRQAGTGSPVDDPGQDEPAKTGLAGWAIALIVVGSLLVVGAVVFALIKFVFIKK